MGTSSAGDWRPCPNGEFGKLAGRLSARRQRSVALGLVFGIGGILIAGATAAAVTQHIIDSVHASSTSDSCPGQHPPLCEPDCTVQPRK